MSTARTACPTGLGADHPRRSTAAACRAAFAVTVQLRLARTAILMVHGRKPIMCSTSAAKLAPFAVTVRRSMACLLYTSGRAAGNADLDRRVLCPSVPLHRQAAELF